MFLGTTEIVPDSTTIWKFRERLAESEKDKDVWDEMQKQLDAAEAHGLKEISADTEKKIKAAVKTVSTDVPAKK
jgi:IS5 family transposase